MQMERELRPVHLVMVTAQNNNKFYDMMPKGDVIEIRYGRIDATCTTITKPIREWDSIYRSKIKKGYVDKSELITDAVINVTKNDHEYLPIDNKAVAEIVDRLQNYAKRVIAANYKITTNQVTQKMIDEAQALIDLLLITDSVKGFNELLLKLYAVIPRKMGKVLDYLVSDKSEFNGIIVKEQSLLDTLRGQVITVEKDTADTNKTDYIHNCTILEAFGITIEPVTDADIIRIKKELGTDAIRYKNAWRVVNKVQETRFQKFVSDNHLTENDLKLLWHGTRNENVWNILKTGLVLRPTNAVITGKMFGYGIYFAPKAKKSIRYTSVPDAYWTKESSRSGFMILHECAYGVPYDVYSFDSKYYNFDYKTLQKVAPDANCLHAHAGKMLRNDEIIFYREDQLTARYLVEIA